MANTRRAKINNKRLQERRYKRSMHIIVCVVIVFTLTLGVSSITMQAQDTEYNDLIELLEEQLEFEEQRTRDIVEYEELTATDDYIEEIAKEKLGMAYPDEIILVTKE